MRKKYVVSIWLAVIFSAIAGIFWHTEFVYSLPTPVPVNYRPVETGTVIPVADRVITKSKQPLFLHFFNPDCPCSKFNIAHFKLLQQHFSDSVSFAIVVMTNKKYTVAEIQEKFGLNIPVLFDTSLAKLCGVYSTPQAVIIDEKQQLYYRGNYNRNRYCTDARTNYAQQALEGLLHHNNILFNGYATKAYGCRLPACLK